MGSTSSKSENTNKTGLLFKAIRNNNFDRATELIISGTDVNCINYSGSTPLIETCRCPRTNEQESARENFVRFLVGKGCSKTKYDIHGKTALYYAELNGHDTIADILDIRRRSTFWNGDCHCKFQSVK